MVPASGAAARRGAAGQSADNAAGQRSHPGQPRAILPAGGGALTPRIIPETKCILSIFGSGDFDSYVCYT